MCSQKLWQALGQSGKPPATVSDREVHGAVLGSWAVTVANRDGHPLALALNDRTYLTLVFPLTPPERFREHFAQALTVALEDFGVGAGTIESQVLALDFLPLVRLTDRTLAGALKKLEFVLDTELDYLSDLRRVQRNLNDFPHPDRDPYVPAEAIVRLFGSIQLEPDPSRRPH